MYQSGYAANTWTIVGGKGNVGLWLDSDNYYFNTTLLDEPL